MSKVTTTLFGTLALLALPVQVPMRETLAWLTDVFEADDGSEDRHQLRGAPRRSVTYSIPQQAWDRSNAYNTERGALRQRWAVPMWSEVQQVGALSAGATSITCNTFFYDFRAGSLALLYQSTSQWQVVEVSAVSIGVLTVSATQAFTNATLLPIRTGYIRGDVNRRGNGHNAVAEVSFDFDDDLELTVSAPTQYLGNDIYFHEALMPGDSYDSSLSARQDFADYDTGLVARRNPWLYVRNSMSYVRRVTTVAEMLALRQWAFRRAGKYRAFWAPSYENDLRKASTGTVTTTFRFKRDAYDDWAADRVHVAFEDDDGNWYPRALSNVTVVDSTTLEATLDTALNLPATRIRRVSYLGLKRLANDAVELEWIGNGVCQTSLTVTELSP